MKFILLLFLVLLETGCAFREKKSSVRTYAGDGPTMKFVEKESAGGPLNTR
ncbi:MAG: hypothetical protein V4710_13390 [Verrucomicrobiota bacterium]